MNLNILWFILIVVLFLGFFFLEGFDFSVGMLLPFLGKTDEERRTIISTIGPFWDGNEVWLLTAGGAMFAAFPNWYATMFSGFYLALLLMLVALIVRGVAFEFRNRDSRPAWRSFWDWMIFVGSLLPGLLWGVALALFPNVMISSLNPAWNLTIYNASSSPYTLTVMSIIALTLVPFVLAYQAWNYWIFRKHVGHHSAVIAHE
ncbi:MAG: cytochrome d ubiquinol oxidase subunit II [Ktedonobacteraceae bacterium]|nr:cytochrome d ubiquinol oxidase subunit II [Ktedonobacteraceae bacterium]